MRIVRARMRGGALALSTADRGAARAALARGDLVVYPTDTLYGLGADPYRDEAVERVYRAKGRPRDQAIALTAGAPDDLWTYGRPTPLARAFCAKHLPGPITVLLRPTAKAPRSLVSPEGRIGLRVPDHPVARALAASFGLVTATSANRHGGPSPRTCEEAVGQLGDAVAIYVDAGRCRYGRESTIVDLTGTALKVIREGALPREAF